VQFGQAGHATKITPVSTSKFASFYAAV
jgi:hypothetical protein